MDKLERLKIKLDIDDLTQNSLLRVLLEEAGEYILAYTRRGQSQWLPAFNSVQVQIAAINYGRLGVEGVQSRSEGGVSTTFCGEQDYPDSIVKTLAPYRLIKGV